MITSISEPRVAAGSAAGHATTTGPQLSYDRYFFVAMAALFIVISGLGFVPQLVIIHTNKIHLHWFTNLHGAIMTGWLLLFLTQALLAAMDRLKYHRQLGLLSVGLGALVWLTTGVVTIGALIRRNPPEGDEQFNTVALSLAAMGLFGWFFTWGILSRENAATHKRLLLLAMIPLISAGVDRIFWLPGLEAAFFVRFIYIDALLIPLVIYDIVTLRRMHRITLIGGVCLVLSQVAVAGAAASTTWHRFAYNALTPHVVRLPEVKLSAAQSDPLLGDYGDKDWKMTVSREGDRLYLTLPDPLRFELWANSETDLFMKKTKWELHFVKDAEGRVTKLINTQPEVTWEKERLK